MNKLDLGNPYEPYSFADLLRRNPAWAQDFVDTIPTGPADLDDMAGAWPACGGSCLEHGRPCPAPRRCWLVEREDDGIEVFRGLIWALGLTAAAVAAALTIVYFV